MQCVVTPVVLPTSFKYVITYIGEELGGIRTINGAFDLLCCVIDDSRTVAETHATVLN